MTTSRARAELFGKRHDKVLRDIDALLAIGPSDLRSLFLIHAEYHDKARKLARGFDLTKDGFTFLAMGFTGKPAAQFKEAYIARFNELEAQARGVHVAAYFGTVRVMVFQFGGRQLRAIT